MRCSARGSAITRYRVPIVVAYVTGVLVLTLAPLPSSASALPRWGDKMVHFGLFAALAPLVLWVLQRGLRGRAATAVACGALAATIEVIQLGLPFRTGDVWDFVWGAAGGLLGSLVGARLLEDVRA